MLSRTRVILFFLLIFNFFLVFLIGLFRLKFLVGEQGFQVKDPERIIRWQINPASPQKAKKLVINDFFQSEQNIKNWLSRGRKKIESELKNHNEFNTIFDSVMNIINILILFTIYSGITSWKLKI